MRRCWVSFESISIRIQIICTKGEENRIELPVVGKNGMVTYTFELKRRHSHIEF